MQIHGCNDTHVALAPLAATVGDLVLEEFEGVETEFVLGDLEGFLEDVGGFVLHEEQIAVGFAFTDLLHDAEEVDATEEIPPGELGDRFRGKFGGRIAEFIDGG